MIVNNHLVLYIKINPAEFSRCYVCVRSILEDLNDDFFVRTRLRHYKMYAYIFTLDEMFCCAGGTVKKINISPNVISKLKQTLLLTERDIDNEPKILSDAQLESIRAVVAYPQFSRIPRLHLSVKTWVKLPIWGGISSPNWQ